MRRLGRSARAHWVLSALTSAGLLSASVVLPVGCARSARDLTLESLTSEELALPVVTVAETGSGQQMLGRGATRPVEPTRKKGNWVSRLFQNSSKSRAQDPFLDGPAPQTGPANSGVAASGQPSGERPTDSTTSQSSVRQTSGARRPTANEIASGSTRPDVETAPQLARSPYAPLPGPRGGGRPAKARLLPEPVTETASTPELEAERSRPVAGSIRELPESPDIEERVGTAQVETNSSDQPAPTESPAESAFARVIPEDSTPSSAVVNNQSAEDVPLERPVRGEALTAAEASPSDANEVPQRDLRTNAGSVRGTESTALRESLRLRLQYLAREANEAERRGNRIEAVRLWEMAARIDAAEPGLWPDDRAKPWERVAALTAPKDRIARARVSSEGKPGHPSVREDVVDLRDRDGRRRTLSAGPSLEAPAPTRTVARVAPEPDMEPRRDAGRNAVAEQSNSAPVLTVPTREPGAGGQARVREIPAENEPEVATTTTVRESNAPSQTPERVAATPRRAAPQGTAQATAAAPVGSRREVTKANGPRLNSAPGNETTRNGTPGHATPAVAKSPQAAPGGRARVRPSAAQAAGNPVRLAGSSEADPVSPSRDVVERIERTPGNATMPPEPSRAVTSREGTRRQRIDPQVASNVARADAITAKAAERQMERAKVELLAAPPRIDPRETARIAAERAAQRELDERLRLEAEKAEADARFAGPLIRANGAAAVEPVAGTELRPGQSPAVRSNPGPIVIAAAPASAPAQTPPASTPAVTPPSTPTPQASATPSPDVTPPKLNAPAASEVATSASAAASAPALSPVPSPVEPAPAPTLTPAPALTPPATTAPAPASAPAPDLVASAAGPTLLAPPAAAPEAAASQPAATIAAPVAAAPATGTESAEPAGDEPEGDLPTALSWRQFWVPIGGLVTGLVGLVGLGLWNVVERRHYQAGKRPPIARTAKATLAK
jgi:hypothetical protein